MEKYITKSGKIGIQGKILTLVILVLAISSLLQLITAFRGINSSGEEVSRVSLTWKLEGDLVSLRYKYREAFGDVSLEGTRLIDQAGRVIGSDTAFVDRVREEYGITATLFSRDGNDYIRVMTNILDGEGKRVTGTYLGEDSAAYGAISRGETYFGEAKILGVNYLTAYDPVFDREGHTVGILYLGIPQGRIHDLIGDAAAKNLSLQVILAFVIILSIALISLFITKRIISPIKIVSRSLNDLSEGEGDLTTTIDVVSGDESGQVASSFNTFVSKLRLLMVDAKDVILRTDGIKYNVSSSTEQTSASVEQITANLTAIGSQVELLDSNINDTAASIEEITRNIESVDQQIISQSTMVEESSAAITQMISSLNSVNRIAESKRATTKALSEAAVRGKGHMEETAGTFQTVVDHINQIQEMASSINNIASQTNLLSMNAAIEAAHAGEAGRGFSVVAEEIRKLADSAARSSRSITGLIKDITGAIMETDRNVGTAAEVLDRIVEEVDDTVNAFFEIGQSVSELNMGGRQILDATTRINDITLGIRDGSAEIKSSTEFMIRGSSLIREVSKQVRDGMDESMGGAREILRAMEEMVGQTTELDLVVDQLKMSFGKFKTA